MIILSRPHPLAVPTEKARERKHRLIIVGVLVASSRRRVRSDRTADAGSAATGESTAKRMVAMRRNFMVPGVLKKDSGGLAHRFPILAAPAMK